MLILSNSSSLTLRLGDAVTSSQLDCVVSYCTSDPACYDWRGITQNTTPITLIQKPAPSKYNTVKFISVFNKDTAPALMIIEVFNTNSYKAIFEWTLDVGDTFIYTDSSGAKVIDSSGKEKVTVGSGGGGGGGVNLQAGANIISSGTALFSNLHGVSWGIAGDTITASVKTDYQSSGNYLTTAMQSNAGSNFIYTSAGLNLTNLSATLASNSLSLSVAAQSVQPVIVSAPNGSFSFSTLKFVNSYGVSWETNGSAIKASVVTDYQSTGNYLTTAMQSNAGTDFVQASAPFSGTNVSGTIASDGISISVADFTPSSQNISLFALGNTTQNSSTVLSADALSFNAIGSLTIGYSDGSIQFSAPNALTTAMQSNAVTISNINLSAGATSGNLSAFTLNNSNGVSFGLNAGVVTATVKTDYQTSGNYLTTAMASNAGSNFVQANAAFAGTNASGTIASNGLSVSVAAQSVVPQNISLYGLGNTTQNSSTALSANALSINAIGSLTVGYSNGSIQLSAPNAITTARASNDAVGLNTAKTNVTWTVNSSGISLDGGAYLTTQSNQNISLYGLGNTTQNSSTVLNASALSFNGLGLNTVGFSNGSIQISASQSTVAQNISLFALNQTTQNSSTALSANALSIAGRGIVTVGYSNGTIQISATEVAQTNQNISLFALGNTTQNSSTVLNASNLSFNAIGSLTVGYSNGSIQFSAPNALTTARASTDAIGLNTAKTNVTWTVNSSGISLDGGLYLTSQTNQTVGLYALGNTTQNSSTTLDARTLSINGLGIITAGYSNGSIQISATQSVQTQSRFNLTLSGNSTSGGAGYQLVSSGVLSLAGGNNITISQDGYAMTISGANAGGAQTAISGMILSNTTYTSGSVSFKDLNGISWQSGANQAIQITHDLQYTSATSAITANALNTSASRVINLVAATNNTGGGTASLSSNISFSNANNISFYTSAGNVIVGSVNTSYRASNDAIGLNTAQSNVTWTVNSSGLSLDARGYAGTGTTFAGANLSASMTLNSVGLNLSMSAAAPGGGGAVNFSAGTTSANLQSVVFVNSNNLSFGLNTGASSQSITASYNNIDIGISNIGNTAGTTGTFDGGGLQYLFAGGNNITLSQSSNGSSVTLSAVGMSFSNSNNITFGTNAGTLTASYAPPLMSYFDNGIAYQGTTAFTMGGSSNFVQPFILPYPVSASFIRIANSWAFGSTTGGTTANTSLTLNNSQSIWVNIFSKGVGASSKSLQLVTQGSVSLVHQVRVEIGAASNNQTVSFNFTYPSSEGAAQGNFAANYNVNSGSYNISTTGLTSFNGFRWLDIPFATSLSAGNYWMAIAQSTATATTGGVAAMTNVTARNTYVAVSQISTNIAGMGVSSNMSTAPWRNGLGYWSTNVIGSSSSSMGLASISTVANQPILPFQILREN